jgi:hypothetical protein
MPRPFGAIIPAVRSSCLDGNLEARRSEKKEDFFPPVTKRVQLIDE